MICSFERKLVLSVSLADFARCPKNGALPGPPPRAIRSWYVSKHKPGCEVLRPFGGPLYPIKGTPLFDSPKPTLLKERSGFNR